MVLNLVHLLLTRVEGITHIIMKELNEDVNTIFPIHLRFIQKAMNHYMKHFYQDLRLLLWRILDAIDHKLGPGPGDHRL